MLTAPVSSLVHAPQVHRRRRQALCCSPSSSPICWADLGNLSKHAFLYKRDKTTHRPQRVEGELNMKSLISSGLHTQLKALGKHSPLLPRPGMTVEASPDQATPRWVCSRAVSMRLPFKAAVNEESGTRTQRCLSLGTRHGWSFCTFTAYTWEPGTEILAHTPG